MVDVFTFTRQRRFDHKRLNVDVSLHERSEMRRQRANSGGLQAVFVYQTWDFDTATLRQIIDETMICDIAINDARFTRFHRMNNERTILLATLISNFIQFAAFERRSVCFPLRDLIFATPEVLINRNFVLFDEVRSIALDKPWHVFTEVLTGFGY